MHASVLINTHNNARFLPACIESVLAQTTAADEIIVCENGSTDETAEVLRRYDGRIVAMESKHDPAMSGMQNQAVAIDAAFRRSSGDIVFLLDGDDVFAREKVGRYLAAFATPSPPVMVQSAMLWLDAAGAVTPPLPEPFRHVADPLAEAYRRREVDFFYPTSALAFQRDFLARVLPLDLADGLDLASDLRLAIAALFAGRVVTLTEELGGWRRHGNSDSRRRLARPFYLARQHRDRVELFNRHCRANDRPTISAWRSGRVYLRWLCAAVPAPWRFRRRWRVRY